MSNDQWADIVISKSFWVGVLSSAAAAALVGVIVYMFRNSFGILKRQRERGRRENETFDAAMRLSSPYVSFAFGVVQARALRYFLTAVFIAYVGDIAGEFINPFNILIYIIALYYIFLGLKWFFKIEKRGLDILSTMPR